MCIVCASVFVVVGFFCVCFFVRVCMLGCFCCLFVWGVFCATVGIIRFLFCIEV